MQAQWVTSMACKPMEHRWGERVALNCAARLQLPDGTVAAGRVVDASISGALIETSLEAPLYTSVNVTLHSGGSRQPALELPACVVRRVPGGLGVEWRDMAAHPLVLLLREAGHDAAAICGRDRAFSRNA